MLIGTSILVLRYSIVYLIDNPEKLYNFIDSVNFNDLSMQVKLCIIFILITIVFFTCHQTYRNIQNNSVANKVFNLIRESFMAETRLEIYENDIINLYAGEFQVNVDYFVKNIFPEVKRLTYLDGNIEIFKQKYNNEFNEECEVEIWRTFY
jgi:hypothetical protein